MSYYLVRSIKIDKKTKRIFITCAENNVRPHTFRTVESVSLSKIYQEKGLEEAEKEILLEYWNGNFQRSDNNYQKSQILNGRSWDFIDGKDEKDSEERIRILKDYLYSNYTLYCNRDKTETIIKSKATGYFCFKRSCKGTAAINDINKAKVFKGVLEARAWLLSVFKESEIASKFEFLIKE